MPIKTGTVLSLLSAQCAYGSHFRWAFIDMMKNNAQDHYRKITRLYL